MTSLRPVVAAIDVGGTRIKGSLVDRDYAVVARTTTPTPDDIVGRIGPAVVAVVDQLLSQGASVGGAQVVGCGVVVPGVVDSTGGIGVRSVNLGWTDLPIRDLVSAHLAVPVVVGHDVRAGLLAETRLGAARGERQVMFAALGTGIAGALLLDGAVLDGDGRSGELGHIVIDEGGERCPCGQRGCLETIASAAAVQRAYAALTGTRVPAEVVVERVVEDEPAAVDVWRRAVTALGRAITTAVTLTGVDLVLIGGGLAESGDVLLDPLRADVDGRITFQRHPRIERAALGDRAGSLGAACLAWDAV